MSRGVKRPATRPGRQAGFTIIELLIATLVFSMVLLLITIGVLTFTKTYFKGVNQSRTQNAARTVLESIAQAVQFSGGQVTSPIDTTGSNGSQGFCIGEQRYSYIQGWKLVDGTPDASQNETRHTLIMDEPGNCGGLAAQDVRSASTTGKELLSPGMRLSVLKVEQIGATQMYRITIKINYGDNDLLYSPSGDSKGAAAEDAKCRFGFAGSQFCATAELSTIVKKRINQAP